MMGDWQGPRPGGLTFALLIGETSARSSERKVLNMVADSRDTEEVDFIYPFGIS
eukprot:SAG31_NODE_686_length_12815_cov_5.367175_11_plen_54_part_00